MKVDPKRITYLNAPAPCVLVSTVDHKGRKNVAAYGYYTTVDQFEVPSVMFGARAFQHTSKNIESTKEFVVGVPPSTLAKKVWKTGYKNEKCDDEFKECELTPIPSETIKPFRIKECSINLECTLLFHFVVGKHVWFVGKVNTAEIDEELYSEDNIEMRSNIDALYHISKEYFCGRNETIKVEPY